MAKQLQYGEEARRSLEKGVNALADIRNLDIRGQALNITLSKSGHSLFTVFKSSLI